VLFDISLFKHPRKKLIPFLSVLTLALFLVSNFGVQPAKALEDYISSYSNEMNKYVVRGLFSNSSYIFKVGSYYFPNEDDIGFAIFDNSRFREQDKVVTVDTPGKQDESTIFSPSFDGDYYLGIWMNNGDYGFVTISVQVNGTGDYLTVKELPPSILSSLKYLWISLGVIAGILLIGGLSFGLVVRKSVKQHQQRVAEAREKGIGLPRYGRKKDKCPFCGVKLPLEYQSQCPYCGAPITED